MRVRRIASVAVLAICVALPAGDTFAEGNTKPTAKARKKAVSALRPTGVHPTPEPIGVSAGIPNPDTITETVNDLGQTVYSVRPSHFDISPPLLEMATAAAEAPPSTAAEYNEPSSDPMVPTSRIIRSNVPDPVVQSVVPSAFSLAAPTTGFNFAGIARPGVSGPSDSNGSVGNNQFVEIVNVTYQVWSLDRATQVATPLLPSAPNINSLWSGFGGPCESQNSGDPIVLFDKTAKRWLISQFTLDLGTGPYYQCVAVSTGADATGTYARYAFAVPNGQHGDYPHIGVWPPSAYYMMAEDETLAVFAAMDRTKMLAANPTATWLVILDPMEGGHMPADLDGFALPPTLAPGIFVSLHSDGMYIYRMKVSFAGSGSASLTLQAKVPVAPATAACGGRTSCIPQSGADNTLHSIGGNLMFRAAYRNFIDHESLVVSHSVDPSVSGVVSGVRWYDFRLSGNPDARCPTFPCVYQEGTLADVPGGRSRWLPSLAMDGAENILVGYSTTGQVDGTDNHSSRYTGRAKADPPGLMTAPETVVVTATANSPGIRWGDYASMSVDPFDDCTFWYVSQYFAAPFGSGWSTQIASAVFPAGSGAGQCPSTTCVTRPAAQPLIGTATVPGDNQITVTWTGVTPTPGAYTIERAVGACGAEGLYRPLAAMAGTASSFTDTGVQGGIKYSYRVRAAADAAGKCQALLGSGCTSATATGTCNLKPSFSGAAAAVSTQQGNCGVTVSWTPGVSGCPLTPSLRYNIFRGTTPDFVPSVANRIATCVVSSSYLDTDNLQSGTTFYYVVRAEDGSQGNGGECGGGNEESNSVIVYGTPFGAGWQGAPGTWTDAGGDVYASLTFGTTVSTSGPGWRFVKTANDPGANHTPGGSYAYRNAGPTASDAYEFLCSRMYTPPLTAGAASLNLHYWERHQLEIHFDGVEIAYSVNGGPWTEVPAPSNGPTEGCDVADDTTDWNVLNCAPASLNACGTPLSEHVITGPFPIDNTCFAKTFAHPAPNPYAHRCHPITGLTPGDSIQFRWGSTADWIYEFEGFYLDDVAVTNVRLPNACVPNTCPGQANGTGCDDGVVCTINDACTAGSCAGTPTTAPAETQHVLVEADKTSFVWDPQPSSTNYDAVRGELGAFPVGPGGGDEVCFDGLGAAGLVDASIPATGTGFWYLSRGQNACGVGTFGQQSSGMPRLTTTCP